MTKTVDFLIIGAGIVGLTLAQRLRTEYPGSTIMLVEKEAKVGQHSSGRNSGVLHSGIYYDKGSLKARLCAEGAKELAQYCEDNDLPISRIGKVILPVNAEESVQLEELIKRAAANNVKAEIIDNQQLMKIMPDASTTAGRALYVPGTSVVDPYQVVERLYSQLKEQNVDFMFGAKAKISGAEDKYVTLSGQKISYGLLINTAGLYADEVAHSLGVGREYEMLPFRGIYYQLSPESSIKLDHLLYPVPDLRVPFLGIHFTTTINGVTYIGPSATPVLGREHYHGISGVHPAEAMQILYRIGALYLENNQGFRLLTNQEIAKLVKRKFAESARKMVPSLSVEDLRPSTKTGIRAQLVNKKTKKLELDFIVEKGNDSVHVLNAVSPAFTSSFSMARYIVEEYISQ